MKEKELLNCPFCGSKAKIFIKKHKLCTGGYDTLFQVQCILRECQAMTLEWYPRKAAANAWNRRANIERRIK